MTYEDLVEFVSRGQAAQRAAKEALRPICSHVWIDPSDPPIARAPYAPVIGTGRRQMKRGTVYVCRNCDARLHV